MLLVGSQNPHKIGEISALLADVPINVVGCDRLPAAETVEESGDTFLQNATIKGLEYAQRAASLPASDLPLWVVADDSGLCVDALDGAPGVHSARYGGTEGHTPANNRKLLAALRNVPPGRRQAHFVCVLVCVAVPGRPDKSPTLLFQVEGRCDGEVAEMARGEKGFGYDPLFIEPSTGLTFAEMDAAQKGRFSHRGHALRLFREEFLPFLRAAPDPETSARDGSARLEE